MGDHFGSDDSDLEGSSMNELRSRPSKAARVDGSPMRDSATPEPRDGGANMDLFGSDNENDGTPRPTTTADDTALDNLFDSDSESRHSTKRSMHGDSDSDSDPHPPAKRKTLVMDAYVPVLSVPRTSDGKYILARMPNLLQLAPQPFTPEAYEDLIPREHSAMEHGVKDAVTADMAAAVEGIIANTVRWRQTADGKRESNARLVRWSDGSTTIVIGGASPESYSITDEPLAATPAGEQHSYVAAHYPHEYLMQAHARLTDQWTFRPSVQSASGRLAVSKLLPRVRARAAGDQAHRQAAAEAVARGTRLREIDTDPELVARRAVEEDERRERLRRKEEKARERREARELQYARADASDEEMGYASPDDSLGRPVQPSYARVRSAGRETARFAPPAGRGGRGAYMDDEDDGFVVDDDEELEVGPRDEFDDEEEEEMAAQRLNGAKRGVYSDDEDEDHGRRQSAGRGAKPRRVMVSDDEDEDDVDI
ncbi:Paf1 complex component [Coemansia interrupta]|uniref:Paf1 complex component n=1 Tax=Coemansia interrupta TaxID=1126814 RepID=A0A9W8HA82_9FUNG|nr:Paf1 complex component [Coemansia interrupta]